jgi:DNA primase
VRDVLIAYDRDDAGDAAAEALMKRLIPEKLDCYRVEFPRGMDANEYALKVRPAAKSLAAALRGASWMGGGAPVGNPDFPALVARTEALIAQRRSQMEAESVTSVAITDGGAGQAGSMMGASGTASSSAASASISIPNPTTTATTPASSEPPRAPTEPQRPLAPRAPEVVAEVKEEEVVFTFGPRRYRVRGLGKALSAEALKVNVLVAAGDVFHVDTLDMYSARQRAAFLKAAADELRTPEETLKKDMGQLLLKLEALQEEALKAKLAPKKTAPTLTDDETTAALALLKHPRLLDTIVEDFERCGVVGEETNKLVGYLAAVSRKLEEPLAILIQSSSAAGKSSLMEAVLAFVPEEDKTKYYVEPRVMRRSADRALSGSATLGAAA